MRTCLDVRVLVTDDIPLRCGLRRLFRGEREWFRENKADIKQALGRESGGSFNAPRAMLSRRSAGQIINAKVIPYADFFRSANDFTSEFEMAANEVVQLLLKDFLRYEV
jgi:hypothetical protein